MLNEKNKKGQVTIFIIIAILIVSAVLIFFLWIQPTYLKPSRAQLDFDACIQDVIEEGVEKLGLQAGFNEPEFYYRHQDNRIGYLCYTNLYYTPCVNQKPFLRQHFEEELEKMTRVDIDYCYETSLNEFRNKGYEVVGEKGDLDISIDYGKIVVNYDAPVVLTKGSSKQFTKFAIESNSPLYEILMVGTSIIQFETKFGDSEVTEFMDYYPDLLIRKLKQSEGTTIYIIEDKQTKTKFQFASRSYAWPAGYGFSEGVYG